MFYVLITYYYGDIGYVSIYLTDCIQYLSILFNGHKIAMQQRRPILSSHFQCKRGLRNHVKQEALSRDIDKCKIDICCLQETKTTEHFDKTTPHENRLITIPSNSQHYINGFILNKKW